jgi:putative ABC transport system permease protein
VVRAEVDPSTLVGAIRQAVLAIDPTQPLSQVRTMDEIVAASVAPRRFNTVVVGSFAFMALVLVATGIYGVMSYFVEQRRHEIGVRIALGSERRELIGLVMARGMKLGGVGLIVGLGGVLLTTRLTRSMLYGVSPLDPMGIGGTLLFLVALAALGSCLPALRATRVSSVEALHSE